MRPTIFVNVELFAKPSFRQSRCGFPKLKKRSGPPLTPAQAAQIHAENLIEGAADWNLDPWDEGAVS